MWSTHLLCGAGRSLVQLDLPRLALWEGEYFSLTVGNSAAQVCNVCGGGLEAVTIFSKLSKVREVQLQRISF